RITMKRYISIITLLTVTLGLSVGCDAAMDVDAGETPLAESSVRPETLTNEATPATSTATQPAPAPQTNPKPADSGAAATPSAEETPANAADGGNGGAPQSKAGPAPGEKQGEEPGEGEAPPAPQPPPAKASIFNGGSAPTQWSPNGTSKMPKYGEDCRLTTNTVFEAATNGATDDSFSLVVYSPKTSTMDVSVVSNAGLAMSATVDLTRGLPGRSYRDAEGWVTYEYAPGLTAELPVIDGTLCFQEKLAVATGDVLAEFSFIVAVDGIYHSMGGNMVIPASALTNAANGLVDADQALDIDLR
ncbi:MAG: hypothetical protein VX938_09160, partial [Myxococcota bacterium]|nr:hypothetical protein [Myxococcota bacterium]